VFKRTNQGYDDIPISQSQMRAIHLRQDVSRTERLLETLPPEVREQFLGSMGVAFASNPGFLGLQPGGLQAGRTVADRDRYRLRPTTTYNSAGASSDSNDIQQQGEQTAASLSGTPVMRF
jgi:hypothetical protein